MKASEGDQAEDADAQQGDTGRLGDGGRTDAGRQARQRWTAADAL